MYMNLIKELAPLDRCHSGPEMELAYDKLISFYPDARLINYKSEQVVDYWKVPPYWVCKKAILKDENGNVIASKERHNLEVFSYSPAVNLELSLDELQSHLFSDPNRPDAICFHFRNQYRHWEPAWGFSIPHNVRENLSDKINYNVNIESSFDFTKDMIQSDYHHQGKLDDTYLFIGHFDHPSQVNDGLAGCVAAYEIIKRLKGRQTKYSYRAFASVEIVGSNFYLFNDDKLADDIKEGLFLGFSGIDEPFVYQQSFHKKSNIDRITKYLLSIKYEGTINVYNHREVIGNDENIFDSASYNIPTGTLMRWPFKDYHTDEDNFNNTKKVSIEETIDFSMQIIDILETDMIVEALFSGIPSLANPDVDLYLSLDAVSGVSGSSKENLNKFECDLREYEREYLKNNTQLLNQFMQNMLRMADGVHTLLDIAETSKIPFNFTAMYASLLEKKGLLKLIEKTK